MIVTPVVVIVTPFEVKAVFEKWQPECHRSKYSR